MLPFTLLKSSLIFSKWFFCLDEKGPQYMISLVCD
ncbi:Uncharacterised protein [Bartonella grahamii]|uniref:Uncharacterized protein n=1 Tax=Bartonella grahamii TaxID=33045 RepID=A0A336NC38_BARGR|nr:Uncharacterised protein [Bartonella grahamii]